MFIIMNFVLSALKTLTVSEVLEIQKNIDRLSTVFQVFPAEKFILVF